MIYNINISQQAIIDNNLQLSLKEAFLLEGLTKMVNGWSGMVYLDHEGERFYWMSYEKILDELPLLELKKDSLYRVLRKLCEKGFLKAHPQNKILRKPFYKLTKLTCELIGIKSDHAEKNPTMRKKIRLIGNDSVQRAEKNPYKERKKIRSYNNIDNNTIDNKDIGDFSENHPSIALFDPKEGKEEKQTPSPLPPPPSEKKKTKRTRIGESFLVELNAIEQCKKNLGDIFPNCDFQHYINEVKDWIESASPHKTYVDWWAMFRGWIRRDLKKSNSYKTINNIYIKGEQDGYFSKLLQKVKAICPPDRQNDIDFIKSQTKRFLKMTGASEEQAVRDFDKLLKSITQNATK